MPMMIDTHVHLSTTRDAVIRDLRRRAYYGVSAVLSMGTDGYEVLDLHSETIPGAARYVSAGRGITMPEPGRTQVPYWITTAAEGRKAVEELAARKVDMVKIWVDDRAGKYKKLTPELYGPIIDESHKRGLRVTAHIFNLEDAKGLMRASASSTPSGNASAIPSTASAIVMASPPSGPFGYCPISNSVPWSRRMASRSSTPYLAGMRRRRSKRLPAAIRRSESPR